jgi:hypothetical protein
MQGAAEKRCERTVRASSTLEPVEYCTSRVDVGRAEKKKSIFLLTYYHLSFRTGITLFFLSFNFCYYYT